MTAPTQIGGRFMNFITVIGMEWDQGHLPEQIRADARRTNHTFRKLDLRSDNTTTKDVMEHLIPALF